MKPGDHVKVRDDSGDEIEGVICMKIQEQSPVPRFVVYSFEPGEIEGQEGKKSHMLVAPAMWLFVIEEDKYNVFHVDGSGPYDFYVEKK